MQSPEIFAALISVGYLGCALVAWTLLAPDSATAFPQALFFLILILNTYFSIRFFRPIYASTPHQRALDVVLGITYLFLAGSIGRSVTFELLAVILFALATTKYILLIRTVNSQVVRRKIEIDILGCILCASALAASLSGYHSESAWTLTGVFAVANVYLLIVRPMYRTR